MWMMLQASRPDDYVVATGQAHSVAEFLDEAASYCGLDWRKFVETDARYLRPTEVDHLLGDPSKIRQKLDWRPKVNFENLVRLMVDHDLELARQEQTLAQAGHKVVLRGTSNG
jgi:GDPmannose 4,6-dehydratase